MSLLSLYADFVERHAAAIEPLEQLARTALVLLPGRVEVAVGLSRAQEQQQQQQQKSGQNATNGGRLPDYSASAASAAAAAERSSLLRGELRFESAFAALGITSAIHALILRRKALREEQNLASSGSVLADANVAWETLALVALRETALIGELGGLLWGGQMLRNQVIFAIEVVRAALRLRLLNYRVHDMLCESLHTDIDPLKKDDVPTKSTPGPSSVFDSSSLPGTSVHPASPLTPGGRSRMHLRHGGPSPSGRTVRTVSRAVADEFRAALFPSVHGRNNTRSDLELQRQKQRDPAEAPIVLANIAGEVLFTLRPILYLLMLARWGRRSWKPWALSLGVDVASLASLQPRNAPQHAEVTRRQMLLLLYVLRSPFFETLRARIPFPFVWLANFLKSLPMVGTIAEALGAYLTLYRSRYFYLSGT